MVSVRPHPSLVLCLRSTSAGRIWVGQPVRETSPSAAALSGSVADRVGIWLDGSCNAWPAHGSRVMHAESRTPARAARPAFGYVRGRRDVDCRGFPESARLGQLCPRPSMRTFHVKHCQRRVAGVPGQGFFRSTGLPRMSPPAYASPHSAGRTVGFGSRAKPGQLYSEPTAMPSWGHDAVVGVVASSEQERGLCPLPPTGVSRETSLSDVRRHGAEGNEDPRCCCSTAHPGRVQSFLIAIRRESANLGALNNKARLFMQSSASTCEQNSLVPGPPRRAVTVIASQKSGLTSCNGSEATLAPGLH